MLQHPLIQSLENPSNPQHSTRVKYCDVGSETDDYPRMTYGAQGVSTWCRKSNDSLRSSYSSTGSNSSLHRASGTTSDTFHPISNSAYSSPIITRRSFDGNLRSVSARNVHASYTSRSYSSSKELCSNSGKSKRDLLDHSNPNGFLDHIDEQLYYNPRTDKKDASSSFNRNRYSSPSSDTIRRTSQDTAVDISPVTHLPVSVSRAVTDDIHRISYTSSLSSSSWMSALQRVRKGTIGGQDIVSIDSSINSVYETPWGRQMNDVFASGDYQSSVFSESFDKKRNPLRRSLDKNTAGVPQSNGNHCSNLGIHDVNTNGSGVVPRTDTALHNRTKTVDDNMSDAHPTVWTDTLLNLPAFKYFSLRNELLLVSKNGDVLFVTKLNKDRSYVRIFVRQKNPLLVHISKLSDAMYQEMEKIKYGNITATTTTTNNNNNNNNNNVNAYANVNVNINVNDNKMKPKENSKLKKDSNNQMNTINGSIFSKHNENNNNENNASRSTIKSEPRKPRHSSDNHSIATLSSFHIEKEYSNYESFSLLSDNNWDMQYRVKELPYKLMKIYMKVGKMLDAVKTRIPKIILYLSKSISENGNIKICGNTRTLPASSKGLRPPSRTSGTNNENKEMQSILCKCMLMSNSPLPDFCVQWSDGAKLRCSLLTGRLVFSRSDRSPQHRRTAGTVNATVGKSIPCKSTDYDHDDMGINSISNVSSITSVGSGSSMCTNTTSDTLLLSTTSSSTSASHARPHNDVSSFRWEGSTCGAVDWADAAPDYLKEYLLVAQRAMKRCLQEDKLETLNYQSVVKGESDACRMGPKIIVESVES